MNHDAEKSGGFTAIELLVTILAAAIFTIALYQLFIFANIYMSGVRQRAVASELAYSYIRRYSAASNSPSSWFTCDPATGASNTNDYTRNAAAAGQTVTSGTLTNISGIAGTVTYKVAAIATYGCNDSNVGSPILIESSITYGRPTQTIKHATMVGY